MQRYRTSKVIEQNAVISPKFYFQRGTKSDRNWIEARMAEIPDDQKQRIADAYDIKYMQCRSRKEANTWLSSVAFEYRQENYGKQKAKV